VSKPAPRVDEEVGVAMEVSLAANREEEREDTLLPVLTMSVSRDSGPWRGSSQRVGSVG
jgi:hypothetical protein